ncbi:hypothetical protein [Pseudorhodoplanes sinuspersici]|uniref:Uncharacterized protein n=1 Tax=Pseudorhodoplanes sinuspersici TaxID=1235591 RepID=A0A1W6ZN94_9HYPH|nr:hypothetical protein [Pseudorhodoplanes sinuspersici]ARP98873.1 hypothetical protein CAK95_07120 [Pseudorhodoplanes sinuspersici]RKE69504.1 hypothetical protein DFP91_3937 [Pseudorhodoplanes sinuspersici]
MRKPFQAAAMLLIAIGMSQPTFAAPQAKQSGCQNQALGNLERLSPEGYAIYKAMSDKKQFLVWLTCDDIQLGLATSVHESVHVLTQEQDSFPLINGEKIRRPHQVSKFFAPKQVAKNFGARDSYVQTYLRPGSATSAEDFLYMLDELNAYSHDLNSAAKLVSLQRRDRQIDHRDGLTAIMAFVVSYTDTAKKSQPATWQGLQAAEPKQVIQTLWAQAETALNSSCDIPAFGRKDKDYIAFISNSKNNTAISELIGRSPKISDECLSPSVTSSTKKSS